MFQKRKSIEDYSEPLNGIKQTTTVYGENTLMTEFVLSKNSILPNHSHPQEQTGYLVEGHIKVRIGDEIFDVYPRDSWTIPGNVVHGADILEDSIAVEVFSPVRKDYLPENEI
jgi:quercetin dioxygenase-like cupin family protein